MFGCFGLTPQDPVPTFKVFCQADQESCLAVRDDGTLALAAADSGDERQHWYKDVRFSRVVRDTEGNPVFSLVNKATNLAIQHSLGPGHPVTLAPFQGSNYFEESVMWTESADLRKHFGFIRMMHNIRLNLDASRVDGVLVLSYGHHDHQLWRTLPWDSEYVDELDSLHTSRIFSKAEDGMNLTIRDGQICVAPTNPGDEYQQWLVDERPGCSIKDQNGFPAFALVSKVTREAVAGEPLFNPRHLKLKPYNPNFLDVSVLWTKGLDVGHGFTLIHMVDSHRCNFRAAFPHGTGVELKPWKKCDDNLLWKITTEDTHFSNIAPTGKCDVVGPRRGSSA